MKIQISMNSTETTAAKRIISKFEGKKISTENMSNDDYENKFLKAHADINDDGSIDMNIGFNTEFVLDCMDLFNDIGISMMSTLKGLYETSKKLCGNFSKKWSKTPDEDLDDWANRMVKNDYTDVPFIAIWREPTKITEEVVKEGKAIRPSQLATKVCTSLKNDMDTDYVYNKIEKDGCFDLVIYKIEDGKAVRSSITKARAYFKKKEEADSYERSTYRPIVETFEDKKKELEQKINDLTEIIESNRESLSEAMDDPSISTEEYKVLMEAQYNRIKERRELRAKLEELSKE